MSDWPLHPDDQIAAPLPAAVLLKAIPDPGGGNPVGIQGIGLDNKSAWTFAPPASADGWQVGWEANVDDDGTYLYDEFAGSVEVYNERIDRRTGQLLAQYPSAPLVITDDCRAVLYDSGTLTMLDASGRQLWSADVNGYDNTKPPLVGAAGPGQNTIVSVFGNGQPTDKVVAFDAATGAVLWTSNAATQANRFLYPHSTVFVGNPGVTVLDARTGTPRLSYATPSKIGILITRDENTLLACPNNAEGDFGTCTVLDLANGRPVTTAAHVVGAWPLASGYLLAQQGLLSFYAQGADPKPAWTIPVPNGLTVQNGSDGPTWTLAGSTLFITFDVPYTSTGTPAPATPTTASINIMTGHVNWQHAGAPSTSFTSLGVWAVGNTLVVPNGDEGSPALDVLDASSGKLLRHVDGDVVGVAEPVTVVTDGTSVVGLDSSTGATLWNVPLPATPSS